MENIALISVQLEEAKRMIEIGSQPHLRLALLLLDNAAEVIMHRMCTRATFLNHGYKQLIDTASKMSGPMVDDDAKWLEEARSKYVTPTRMKKIDRYFDEKARFLARVGDIEQPVAQVLCKMHSYRNEAYHNDTLRVGSLRPCVMLYFDLACDLFGRCQPMWVKISDPPDSLARYVQKGTRGGLDLPARIGEALRRELNLDLPAIRESLIRHLNDRLDEIDESLDFIAVNEPVSRSRAAVLHIVQTWTSNPDPFATDEEVFAEDVKFSMADLLRWRQRVTAIERLDNRLRMFIEFARIEGEFEPLEKQVKEIAILVDQHIEDQIDAIRGK